MARQADAIIIGAGVIGAATAFELGKRGYKTLNIDKLPSAGYGPTSNSCAIVRAHYSSRDGVAMAYEGFSYWQDWERYLGVVDDMGTSRYMQCGTVLLKSATGHHEKVLTHYRDLGVEYEEWDNAKLKEKVPVYSTDAFWPPKRPDDPHFWDEPQAELDGAIFTPARATSTIPQLATHNLQRAAEAKGGEFRFRAEVAEIRRAGGRVAGVTLDRRHRDRRPGRGQCRRPALVRHQPHGGRRGRDERQHPRAEPRGPPRALAAGLRLRAGRLPHLRRRHRDLLPPRERQQHPHRVRGPRLRPARLGRRARRLRPPRHRAAVGGAGLPPRAAHAVAADPNERKGIVDLYDVSDDWFPIYDRSVLDGFYMAIGTSGNQFKNAPVVGHLMAELIDRLEHGHDHDAEPVKVRCAYNERSPQRRLLLAPREVNPDSSFSVNG